MEEDYGEKDAGRMVRECGPRLGLPMGAAELADPGKGDERKALLPELLCRRTAVGFEWISTRLGMGRPGSASRQVGNVKRDGKLVNQINELEEMLQCGD